MLSPCAILACDDEVLERVLKPSGFFRIKAERVRAFCRYLVGRYGGDMAKMARQPLEVLRAELLDTHGIGPETADDILLYACGKPVFVVDAYTRRILGRHGLIDRRDMPYEGLRGLFERHVKPDVGVYSEYHGLLVFIGKDFCRRVPRCAECPLAGLLKSGQPIMP